ncbi:MAG: hypothetical protein U0840_27525 [Gemmataceae bacterium]
MPNEPFDSLSFELALRRARLCAVLLPPQHVPVDWLRALAAEVCPALANIPRAMDVLVRSLFNQGLLRSDSELSPVAHANERAARQVRDALDEEEAVALKKLLRDFCSKRLEAWRAERTQRINRVMTGDPMKAVTGWTVPPIEEVRARAIGDDRVEIVDFGDGTYSVRVPMALAWEDESLQAFAQQEFASEDLEGIAWALRTKLLTAGVLGAEKERIGDLHLRQPQSTRAALVAGLFWLSLAHQGYGEGSSCGIAWSLAGKAVEILEGARERQPDDAGVAALLAEAKRAHWSYDN